MSPPTRVLRCGPFWTRGQRTFVHLQDSLAARSAPPGARGEDSAHCAREAGSMASALLIAQRRRLVVGAMDVDCAYLWTRRARRKQPHTGCDTQTTLGWRHADLSGALDGVLRRVDDLAARVLRLRDEARGIGRAA